MARHLICDSGRTAITAQGSQRIYYAWSTEGIAAGATYELLYSELHYTEQVEADRLTEARELDRAEARANTQ